MGGRDPEASALRGWEVSSRGCREEMNREPPVAEERFVQVRADEQRLRPLEYHEEMTFVEAYQKGLLRSKTRVRLLGF
jgi:hypothetical protein